MSRLRHRPSLGPPADGRRCATSATTCPRRSPTSSTTASTPTRENVDVDLRRRGRGLLDPRRRRRHRDDADASSTRRCATAANAPTPTQRARALRTRPQDRLAQSVPAPHRRDPRGAAAAGSRSAAGTSTTSPNGLLGARAPPPRELPPPPARAAARRRPGRSCSGSTSTGSSPTATPTAPPHGGPCDAMASEVGDAPRDGLPPLPRRRGCDRRRGVVIVASTASRSTAWDPFAREEPRTQDAARGRRSSCRWRTAARRRSRSARTCCPARFSSPRPRPTRSPPGPNRWNRQQGFYIYRRDRLIQSGGWNRLRTLDEHSKLARIAVDLPVGHEELFGDQRREDAS